MSHTTQPQLLEQVRLAIIRACESQNLCEAGDSDRLWSDFFDQYNVILRRFARSVGCDPGIIDEVVCLVWDDVRKYLPTFEYEPARGKFRSWLYKIVKRKAIDEARRLGRQRRVVVDSRTTSFWSQISDPKHPADPLEQLYEQELCYCILEKFNTEASANAKEVIKCCVMDGQDCEDVARRLSLTAANVRQLKSRGIAQLKIIAGELFGPNPLI